MREFKKGIIFTNDKCMGCNKCISNCSIFGANIAIHENGLPKIYVHAEKCNHCGKCVNLCIHHARDYSDDIEEFFLALRSGEKISLIVDESFYFCYGEKSFQILGYLKSLGVEKIYDISIGNELSIWAHVNYLKNHRQDKNRAFIAQFCPAFINIIELYHIDLLDKLIPIHSPLICTAIYVHKYLRDSNKIAFLGSCISKKDEINSVCTNNNVNWNITINRLMEKLKDIDFSKYHAEANLSTAGINDQIFLSGNFHRDLAQFFSKKEYIPNYTGLNENTLAKLRLPIKPESEFTPLFVDVQACINGCKEGPGINKENISTTTIQNNSIKYYNKKNKNFNESLSYEERFHLINESFSKLNIKDFEREFQNRYLQSSRIPETILNQVFMEMLKTTEEKRNINCHSCGNKTCKEMAMAIACGYNIKENCIHYMNDEMIRRFHIDYLTNIPNRIGFTKNIKTLLEQNPEKEYLLIFGNINNLKIINNMYTSFTGDKVINLIAKSLNDFIKDKGLIGRFDGGTYSLCFENIPEYIEQLKSIKMFAAKSIGIENPVTMRFGYTIIKDKTKPIDLYLNQAEVAMDSNRNLKQNTYSFYSKEIHDKIMQEVFLTSEIQKAIDNDELTIYLQPQYTPKGKLAGAEVLCRWIKPNNELIPPNEFIPLSEKNGYIKFIDRIIWEKTFLLIREWLDIGINVLPLSLNISRISIESDEIVFIIEKLKNQYNIPDNLVSFEITESAYSKNQKNLIDKIYKIKDLGFLISMDDFGSGYSSLNALKDIPIDFLKLDMDFFKETENSDKSKNIILSIIKMARELGLTTIAEGIETQEQADFLNSIGCDLIQGYLFAKPMPPENYLSLIDKSPTISKNEKSNNKIIDIKKFLDINSDEYFMFENYNNASLIIEYENKNITILKFNSKVLNLFNIQDKNNSKIYSFLKNYFEVKSKNLFIEAINKAISTDQEIIIENSYKNNNESFTIWIKFHIKPFYSSTNSYIIFINLEDITKEKQNEKKLLITNSQLNLLLEKSQVGLCLMNIYFEQKKISDSFKLKILQVNKQFLEISGYSYKEVMNWTQKEASNIVHPLDKISLLTKCIKSFKGDEILPFEHTFKAKHKSGTYLKVKILISASKETDGSYNFITNYILLEK